MFRLRPCCSHFLKKDGILINHNPWLRKRTNELYKRRHCFVKVCCDSSQKHLQAKKSQSQLPILIILGHLNPKSFNDSPEIFSVRHLVGDQIGVLLRWRAKVI